MIRCLACEIAGNEDEGEAGAAKLRSREGGVATRRDVPVGRIEIGLRWLCDWCCLREVSQRMLSLMQSRCADV